MNTPTSSSRRVRTGLFEIDFSSGELQKNGLKVPLQEQPFRVLGILLEHPGEVVTRGELQTRLWPADTYVGFDEGLNVAIRKLRLAFGDSADNPRFIETLPRRGYRFIAPVSEPHRNHALQGDAIAGRATREFSEDQAPGTLDLSRPRSIVRSWSRKLVVPAAVAVLLVLAAVAYRMRPRPSSDSAAEKRIMLAILPFQNLSNDPTQEYFSDGLTEETITDLGQLSPEKLGVIARTSAMAYKHTDKTVGQIGHELGVDYVLEGSVRREGDRVRISAQLIRVSDQTHLWARNYDREVKDLIEVQNDLGNAITEQVQAELTPQHRIELYKTHTVNPEAFDLYLKGRYYWNQRTPAGIKESIGYFQQATAKDPDFALAYAGLADAYNISNIVGPYSAKESLPQAGAAARKAIQLDPSLAEAHAALGMEKSHYEFDFPGAQKEFLKAIEVNPNSAYAHLFYSNCFLLPMGRTSEAITENKKALELDPLSSPISNFLGMTYMFAGEYENSYQQFQRTIAMDPTFPLAHQYFAFLLTMMGRYPEAIQENEKSEILSGSSPQNAATEAAAMLEAFQVGGEKGYWERTLARTVTKLNQTRGTSPSPGNVAAVYALAGQKDKAFEWLEKAYEERDGQDVTLLKCDPSFKNLRGDPRFSALLRRMGLPE
jgi:TolB-like protein/DNA-binding winged helix-turn-helix (wHTH) protein/Flp pilus assembly protein TadD